MSGYIIFDKSELLDVITFMPPGGVFEKKKFKGLKYIRVNIKGGDGGKSIFGDLGEDGEFVSVEYAAKYLPDYVHIKLGKGGKGMGGPETDGIV